MYRCGVGSHNDMTGEEQRAESTTCGREIQCACDVQRSTGVILPDCRPIPTSRQHGGVEGVMGECV